MRIREGDPLEIFTDCEGVIASAGVPKKEYFEKRLSADLDKLTENRSSYRYKSGDRRLAVIDDASGTHFISCAVPIIADGDVIGSVVCASSDGEATIDGDVEFRLIQTAAAFLARQLQ